jgi:NAD(P)-dependent dehydrogenase (short-subunit alcohol dehydrogenase family)
MTDTMKPVSENELMSTNWLEGAPNCSEGQKLVIVGGSSGMGRRTAADVVCAGGCAVIIGQDASKVDDTIQALAKDGSAHSITADLTDRTQVDRVCEQLADEHADATLLVNAAGFFIPRLSWTTPPPTTRTSNWIGQPFSSPRRWSGGMIEQGRGGAIVNIGSMWADQAIGATPWSGYSVAKGGCTHSPTTWPSSSALTRFG